MRDTPEVLHILRSRVSFFLKGVTLVVASLLPVISNAGTLHLRIGPSEQYPEIVELPQNTALNPIERRQDWLRVEAESYEGWVHVDELLRNISFNRPHPEQFKYKKDPGNLGLELSYSSEEALGIGLNFIAWDQSLSLRLNKSTYANGGWTAIEFGGNASLYQKDRLNLNMFMGLGLGLGNQDESRWSDERESIQLPLFTLSSDIEWRFEENSIAGLRFQIQNALAGNSEYHGALALVWKIRL